MTPKKQGRRLMVRFALIPLVAIIATIAVLGAMVVGLAVFVDSRDGVPGEPSASSKDGDGDGIPDRIETSGWRTERGDRYVTNPENPDTDADGLTDGDEAGLLVTPTQSKELYAGYSNPIKPDTDDDLLGDADEADLSLNPLESDSDSDGLTDGREVDVVGSAPDLADTDGDGYDDLYEDANRDGQGLDPLWFDVKVSKRSYVTDFATGALLGDARRKDSLAWLAGNLTSGASSSIPVVGSILGGVGDVRDAVASAVRADWVGSGFSAIGAVPGGDAVAIPRKARRFVEDNPKLAAETGLMIAKSRKIPRKYKIKASALVWKNWNALQEQGGASEQSLLTLQEGRTNLDDLGKARKHPNHIAGAPGDFLSTRKDGETSVENSYGATENGVDKNVRLLTGGCPDVCKSRFRIVDVLVDGVAHESKVGYLPWSPSTESQIRTDAWLIKNGTIDGAYWHFYASSVSKTIGADKKVYDLLQELGLSYTIHLPT